MGWKAGNASKLKSSKPRASGTGWFAVADGGRVKASVHHDSQSNGGVCGGKGSETFCFLGAQSKHRGFLTAGSSELDSDKRLFREREREASWVEVGNGKSEWEVLMGEGGLNSAKRDLARYKKRNATHERHLHGRDRTKWGSEGSE